MRSREAPSIPKLKHLPTAEIDRGSSSSQARGKTIALGDSACDFSNYNRLVARVVDAFGDEVKASRWLSLPNAELEGASPLEVAEKDGYRGETVEPILIRIQHGIYN